MILDLNDIRKEESKDNLKSGKTEHSACPSSKPLPSNSNVVRRVYHTRQEFNIYPNGQIYPGKIQGWFEDKIYAVKKKEKKQITNKYVKKEGVVEL